MVRLRNNSSLLTRLPERMTGKLFESARRGHAPARHVLFSAGDPGDGIYRIDSGLIKIVVQSPDGAERVLAVLGRGAIIGELAMIDGLPRSGSAIVLEDCSYRFVATNAFHAFGQSNPDFYRELLVILAQRLRETDKALAAATFLSVRGRIANALLDLADDVGRQLESGAIIIPHKISNADIAALAGVARENVSRLLGEWRDRGLVDQSGRFHCIQDPDALERETL